MTERLILAIGGLSIASCNLLSTVVDGRYTTKTNKESKMTALIITAAILFAVGVAVLFVLALDEAGAF